MTVFCHLSPVTLHPREAAIRHVDGEAHSEALQALRDVVKRPLVTLQCYLNEAGERTNLDAMEATAKRHSVTMDSPEHDGGFFRALRPRKGWQLRLAEAMRREMGVEVSWKALPESMDALLEFLAARLPGAWEPQSGDWADRERALLRAIPLRFEAAAPHHEFAKGIAHYFHGKVCRNRKALEVWDERLKRWTACDQGETLLEQLRPLVSDALHAEAGAVDELRVFVICHPPFLAGRRIRAPPRSLGNPG